MPRSVKLSKLLTKARADADLSTAAVASRIGITRQHYELMEKGESENPRLDTLRGLVKLYKFDPAILFR